MTGVIGYGNGEGGDDYDDYDDDDDYNFTTFHCLTHDCYTVELALLSQFKTVVRDK